MKTFLIISGSVLVRMKKVQTSVVEKIETDISWSITFFPLENRAVYGKVWINTVQPEKPQMTIWYTRIACWLLKNTKVSKVRPPLCPNPTKRNHTQSFLMVLHAQSTVRKMIVMSHKNRKRKL
jgi:hypothetical protein